MERAIATRAAASMTQERGFHMKLRNCDGDVRAAPHEEDGSMTYLEEGVLLLALELVGAENLETAGSLLSGETLVVTLEEFEDVLDGDGLDVDLLLVVQVLSLELNLKRRRQFDAALDA